MRCDGDPPARRPDYSRLRRNRSPDFAYRNLSRRRAFSRQPRCCRGDSMTASERVMVVTAHPDDSEFGAGGTIAKLVKEGREVTYVIVTNGDKGSADRTMTPERLVPIRQEEQRDAARVLGVVGVVFLGYEDGEVEDTRRL